MSIPGQSRIYKIYNPAFHRHYEIKSSTDEQLYYGNVSVFGFRKPDITLHAGNSSSPKESPIVAACKFVKFSGDFKLALGDPDDHRNVQWEDMTKDSVFHSRFKFEMAIPLPEGNGIGSHRAGFIWKRTHNEAVESEEGNGATPTWASSRNFKLEEEKTGRIIAVFNKEISFSKCGVLEVRVDYGPGFDVMVINSCVGLYERARRRNNSAGGGGGGGGG